MDPRNLGLVSRPRTRGFSLAELAIVLLVLSVLSAGLVSSVSSRVREEQRRETQRSLDRIYDALVGYAVIYGRLPCPAISATDGNENRTGTGVCTGSRRYGVLPWATLGVTGVDAWGNRFWYRVKNGLEANPDFAKFSDPSSDDLRVSSCDNFADSNNPCKLANSPEVAAVVISAGENRGWAVSAEGVAQEAGSALELRNQLQSDRKNFVSTQPMAADAPAGAFDDMLIWVPRTILINRLIEARRLP